MNDIAARFVERHPGFSLDVALNLPGRGVTALFGRSGSGKTTVLRCLAGLVRAETGRLQIGDEIWQDEKRFLPPHRRAVGYVFQEASLFDHLSVEANLRYGLRRVRGSAPKGGIGFGEVVSMLGLERLLARAPRTLSGGERQRVAIGRALLTSPRLLLMDEPLSALDADGKAEVLAYLDRLCRQLALPVVYVTHDMTELLRLADHMVLLESGRVRAAGPLADLLARLDLPMARHREATTVLAARVLGRDRDYGLLEVEVVGGRLLLPLGEGIGAVETGAVEIGAPARVRVVASDVSLARRHPAETTVLNILPARILAAEPVAAHQMNVLLRLGESDDGGDASGEGAQLLARITRKSWDLLELAPGVPVQAMVKAVSLAEDLPTTAIPK